MGGQMTKDLGVFNEEDRIKTPQGWQRYRLLNSDPRSATAGITRTPIHVECTPTSKAKTSRSRVIKKTPKTLLDKIELDQEIDTQTSDISIEKSSISHEMLANDKVNCTSQDNALKITEESFLKENKPNDETDMDVTSESVNGSSLQSVVVVTETKGYLETDMDMVIAGDNMDESPESPVIKKDIIELTDVRSPTLEINRTPVLVQCTPELFALHARINNMSFCDLEMQPDDPSAVLSEDDCATPKTQSTVNIWLEDVENKSNNCDSPYNTSFVESPKTVAKKQMELNAFKKKLFFTPDVKEISKSKVFTPDGKEILKPRPRTPLGNIQAGQINDSPQKMMRAKQWRNIQEERQRRGIVDSENTPPSLPPLSKISSAPGKILANKRTKTLWDDENTMFI